MRKVAYRPRAAKVKAGGTQPHQKAERQLKESPVAKLQAGKDAGMDRADVKG